MILKRMMQMGVLLGLFAIIGTTILAITHEQTKERIAENERNVLLRNLHAVISPDTHDNELFSDTIEVTDAKLLGSKKPITVYRARLNKTPVAAVFAAIAPDGYNGDIKLLIAIKMDGSLLGVRVVGHRETPGLGDYIEVARSDWITKFTGLSLNNPAKKSWHVKRDGGEFDQFTGATITPRAVVRAVYNSLVYFEQHQQDVFR
ncbi:MAG: electron transport complex subunit RsxG [Gammaproteobacteria bacterium]|nr:electron transport complex subunit RsxG [Gammaproteobacteria bacterium]